MIRFQAIYGLCNRLRGIVGAIELGRLTSRDVDIFWVADRDLPARFDQLFEKITLPNVKGVNDKLPLIFHLWGFKNRFINKFLKWFGFQKVFSEFQIHWYIDKYDSIEQLAQKHQIFNFKSYKNVCYKTGNDFGIFRPVSHLTEQIEKITSKFNEFTYGFHIRRTDHSQAITYSPDELFIKEIEMIIRTNIQAVFYVASDDLAIKNKLVEMFGKRIITDLRDIRRASLQDMERAVIELYALSKTKCIYGSYWSSFSETAASIGGIPLVTLVEK